MRGPRRRIYDRNAQAIANFIAMDISKYICAKSQFYLFAQVELVSPQQSNLIKI